MLVALILDVVYLFLLIAVSPIIFYRMVVKGKYRHTLRQRLGFADLPGPVDIWIHGVSVGEIKAVLPLVEKLSQLSQYKILISSTSSRGLQIAGSLYGEQHQIISFPLDFSWSVKHFFSRLTPKLIVLMELELWPNFLLQAHQQKIPVVLVNGRISPKSARRYGYCPRLFFWVTRGISRFCVQSTIYEKRLRQLKIEPERIIITGNLKFDAVGKQVSPDPLLHELKKYVLLIAGSTHHPEEKFLVESYRQLCKNFPSLRLLLVPRHPERAEQIAGCITESGFIPVRRSSICSEHPFSQREILIGDVMGELAALYSLAKIAFIGGSLIPHGGQNFIEPAAQGNAVICGPCMDNFPDIRLFLEEQAVFQVQSPQQLTDKLQELLVDAKMMVDVGNKARTLVEKQKGSVQKSYKICLDLLEFGEYDE